MLFAFLGLILMLIPVEQAQLLQYLYLPAALLALVYLRYTKQERQKGVLS